MAIRTYQARLQFLVVFYMVQPIVFQAIGVLSLKNADISSTGFPSTVTPHEARNSSISYRPGMPNMSSKEENKTLLYNGDTSNTTNFPFLLSTYLQIIHSTHMEASHPSESTAETTTEVTNFPAESFISNSTYQTPGQEDSKITTSVITQKEITLPSAVSSLSSGTMAHSVSASQFPATGYRMKTSEFILTVAFALILTLTILGLLVYILNKYRIRRSQYSHHQLHDTSFDTVDRYTTPDDTLVISGGLYDAPRLYNSNMTPYEDEEFQTDHLPISAQPGQFRLEFFGDKENGISLTSETLQVPPGNYNGCTEGIFKVCN